MGGAPGIETGQSTGNLLRTSSLTGARGQAPITSQVVATHHETHAFPCRLGRQRLGCRGRVWVLGEGPLHTLLTSKIGHFLEKVWTPYELLPTVCRQVASHFAGGLVPRLQGLGSGCRAYFSVPGSFYVFGFSL